MAWIGYFAYDGAEIVNVDRVEAYLASASVPWFRPVYKSGAIATLESTTYTTPFADSPLWVDPDRPETYDFWGCYPLSVTGIENSTKTAEVLENVGDGGVVGPLRAATRAAVFEVALLGGSECAVEAGLQWLKNALQGDQCNAGYSGAELCYFACEPCIEGECTEAAVTECSERNLRTLRNVRVMSGPTITARRIAEDGGAIWVVTFTAVAGVPWEFGSEVELVEGFLVEPNPWVPTVVPADWAFDDAGEPFEDVDCSGVAYDPLVDPTCPAIEVPPEVPSIALGCFTAPEGWTRRWFTIPRKYVPYWGDVVPVVQIQAQADEVRNLRLRFYADLDANASVLEDPCSFCGDIIFSFIPPSHTLTFDGASQTVTAEGPGGVVRRADSLVFQSNGTPFDWPLLTCGLGYVVSVDVPDDFTGDLPAVDLALVPRGAA